MPRKQLLLLFLANLVPYTIAGGLVPLLPIYALELKASEAMVGYYFSIAFLALAVGTIITGWLADRLQRRKALLIIASVAVIPSIFLMGRASTIWQLAGATILVWFSCGMVLSLTATLAGLFAAKDERGRVLGIIAMTNGLGSIIGGLSIGPIVDRWGYPTALTALSLYSIILLISAVFVKDKKIEAVWSNTESKITKKNGFGKAYFILLAAFVITTLTTSVVLMGRSLSMKSLDFTATAITITNVVSGLVSLPFPLILGWLSDRFGRKRLLVLCYLSISLAMIILALSRSLWHFWVFMIICRIGQGNGNVAAAFVTDLVEPKALGRGVSLLQSMGQVGMTIGYLIVGNLFQAFGISTTVIISIALPIIGIILISLIRVKKREEAWISGT